MLKKRIIPVQLLMGERLVKTIRFDEYRDVGDPVSSSRIYNDSDADELALLNIDRDNRSIDFMLSLIDRISEVCFMPLAMGGGIRTLEDAERLIKGGADKIVLNSEAYNNPQLIHNIATVFGNQAVVVSIDVFREGGDYALYSDCGRRRQHIALDDHVLRCIEQGAGEILVNAVDRDGVMEGYDIELIERVVKLSNVPVIGCGGAGDFAHLRDAFLQSHCSALACGSLFNFGDNNPIRAKAFQIGRASCRERV